ncbi:SCO family protein [Rhodoferax sp.]|uniref:SCO family protein n=1 Tax=Rhodoferax sp. TaxID=50421 RepID=UPI0028415D29|nr:SCO family protein [Rhodoferax sp.]MDR3370152.1 SCO family protein [Rhodoferax sp.]
MKFHAFYPKKAIALMLFASVTMGTNAFVAQAHGLHPEKGLTVTTAQYTVPPLWLIRDDGQKVLLTQELNDGRPVILNFIYTTCTGICPLMSQVFSEFQSRLGDQREKVHMVSITIDPEQDTPARLRVYAQRYSAGSQWQHYTGTVNAIIATEKAFNVYGGDKMNHSSLTLLRSAPGKSWVRMDGFASSQDLMDQFAKLTASSASLTSTN